MPLIVRPRWLISCLCSLLLTACNEITGNERGGTINGTPYNADIALNKAYSDWLDETLGFKPMSNEDALKKASSHCAQYGKKARITSIESGRTFFECS
jgi:hypothetical protein